MTARPVLGKRPSDREVSPPPTKRKQQSTTTNKAVANFFKPASQKEKDLDQMSWRVLHKTLLVGRYGTSNTLQNIQGKGNRKIAAFDFDSTLIKPASNRKFAKDASDWKWWDPCVPTKLRQLHEEGYLIAVLSNQAGITLSPDPKTLKSDQKRLADFKSKASAVFRQLDLPITLYAATAYDVYRKPRTGMWRELLEEHDLDQGGAVNLSECLFIGDAAGREATGSGLKNDFSCGDRNFAANVGIPFLTPEEYFLGEEPRAFSRSFEPVAFLEAGASNTQAITYAKKNPLDIVLFVGSPGAGKSSFYWRYLQPLGYERVNQDILKSVSTVDFLTCSFIATNLAILDRAFQYPREKCLKAASDFLETRTSVVVDNTNADVATRAVWVALSKQFKIPIRCVHFTAPPSLCEHNDAVRAMNAGHETNPENRLLLPKTAFLGFTKRYSEPQISEGFQDIVNVDFKFEGSEAFKKLWTKYWL